MLFFPTQMTLYIDLNRHLFMLSGWDLNYFPWSDLKLSIIVLLWGNWIFAKYFDVIIMRCSYCKLWLFDSRQSYEKNFVKLCSSQGFNCTLFPFFNENWEACCLCVLIWSGCTVGSNFRYFLQYQKICFQQEKVCKLL